MLKKVLKQIINDKYTLLVILVFGVILLSRLLFLGADLPSTHVEIEEKLGGYNARNMVLFNRWPLYQNWFQSMVYSPVQTLISYLSFTLFGIGLAQFRFPMVLFALIGLYFFFIILLKQMNPVFALFGLILYAFNFEMTVWNRSGLTENLYLFFIPLSIYFFTKEYLSNKDLFWLLFLAALGVVTKLDGLPFFISVAVFASYLSFKAKKISKNFQFMILGTLGALAVLVLLFILFGAFNYTSVMYSFYFEIMRNQGPILQSVFNTFRKFILILLSIDPYLFLALLVSIPVLLANRLKLNKLDWFMMIFLLVGVLTRLQVATYIIYWKRVIFLYFPMVYAIIRSLFFLFAFNSFAFSNEKKPGKQTLLLLFSTCWGLLSIILFFSYFNASISRIYGFGEYKESFHYSKGAFLFLLAVMIAAIGSFNYLLLFGQVKKLKNILTISILFLALLSLITNSFNVSKMFLPGNVRYSYQNNKKYASLIPEAEMIVSHEQAFRAFVYLSKHDFYFNHDGGANPVAYREVFERKDLRYFILNIEEFWRDRWGLTNQDRLVFIKETYPDLKLIDVFLASRVPLAIYDKYGNSQ